MYILGKKELIDILEELLENCGDNLGRNGEYLSTMAGKARDMAENLDIERND